MTGTRTLLACLLAATLAGCGSTADPAPKAEERVAAAEEPPRETFGCDELAAEAVRISKGEDPELIKVRNPRVVKDRRDTVEVPTGSGDALVLLCRGRGIWSDGEDTAVKIKATVDSDHDTFVYYEAIY